MSSVQNTSNTTTIVTDEWQTITSKKGRVTKDPVSSNAVAVSTPPNSWASRVSGSQNTFEAIASDEETVSSGEAPTAPPAPVKALAKGKFKVNDKKVVRTLDFEDSTAVPAPVVVETAPVPAPAVVETASVPAPAVVETASVPAHVKSWARHVAVVPNVKTSAPDSVVAALTTALTAASAAGDHATVATVASAIAMHYKSTDTTSVPVKVTKPQGFTKVKMHVAPDTAPATAPTKVPKVSKTQVKTTVPMGVKAPYKPRQNASDDAYKQALKNAEDEFFDECLPRAEATGKLKGAPDAALQKEFWEQTDQPALSMLNWSMVVCKVPVHDFDPVPIGPKNMVFSRYQFAENRFFQKRLREFFLSKLPENCWVAFRLVGKPATEKFASTEAFLVRIGNRLGSE